MHKIVTSIPWNVKFSLCRESSLKIYKFYLLSLKQFLILIISHGQVLVIES